MGHRTDVTNTRTGWDRASAGMVAASLQALATPSRLLILASLQDGPLTVGELTEAVAMEQSAVSHQLRLLRDAGLVTAERRGRHVHYALFDDHVAQMIDQARDHAEHLQLGIQLRALDRTTSGS